MLTKLRSSKHLSLLTALFFGLVLSLALTSLSPTTDAAAATEPNSPVSGKVTAKGQDNFTFSVADKVVTLRVTSATQFIRDGKAAKFADLQVGMQVAVTTQFDAKSKLYNAVRVTLPATPPPPVVCNNSGAMTAKVSSKTATNFSVVWANGEAGKVPFLVNADTKFYQNDKLVAFDQLQVGQNITFYVRACSDGKYTALKVMLPPTATPTPTCYTSVAMVGKVASKTAAGFTINWGNGIVSKIFLVNAETKFYQNDKLVTYDQLQVGQIVNFYTRNCTDGKNTAIKVILPPQ